MITTSAPAAARPAITVEPSFSIRTTSKVGARDVGEDIGAGAEGGVEGDVREDVEAPASAPAPALGGVAAERDCCVVSGLGREAAGDRATAGAPVCGAAAELLSGGDSGWPGVSGADWPVPPPSAASPLFSTPFAVADG